MQFKKKVMYSGIISAAALITSIIFPIIPCRVAPVVQPPIFKWALCTLNPDTINTGSIKEFFGYTSLLTDAYIITLIIAFLASMTFFHYATKKKKN